MWPKAMQRGCPPAREGVAGREEGGKGAVLAASHLGVDAGVGDWDLAWLCHPACKPRQKIGFGGPIRQYTKLEPKRCSPEASGCGERTEGV